nr:probable polyamine transporter At1g31830 [Malus domestica]
MLGGGVPRVAAVLVLTLLLTYMNYRCLTIVGWVAVLLGIFSIIPFVVMGLVAIPKVKPSRWLVVNLRNVDWNLYLNTLLESQLLGLDKYTCRRDGYFSDIAKIIGGVWLRWWIQGAAAVSNMGMFVAEMSSDSFQLLGMAERGMLPKFFGS